MTIAFAPPSKGRPLERPAIEKSLTRGCSIPEGIAKRIVLRTTVRPRECSEHPFGNSNGVR